MKPMSNRDRKSDGPIVPRKQSNKELASTDSAENVEGRGSTKRKERQLDTGQTQRWVTVQSKLALLHQKARGDKRLRFNALMHHVWNPVVLEHAYRNIKGSASPGIDGQTYVSYGAKLSENLANLSERLRRGGYKAKPVRRVYIPKSDGKKRPLGIPVLEDKIVQRAVTMVLNTIYEADFQGFSYGFRPRRSQHQALDALYVGLMTRRVRWILDADIQNFFGQVNHEWLIRFMEHRIADTRILRLILKWLKAGVMEEGVITQAEEGTPQGGSISPLLANIYLHYVVDLWTQQWRKKKAQSEMVIVRYADDTVMGFQFKQDADSYLAGLKERLAQFGLSLHAEKTRMLEFGRYAAMNRKDRGQGKPETFDFLGFTHICGKNRRGEFTIIRHTIKKRMRAKVLQIKRELNKRMHSKIPETGVWLISVLNGYYRYYGVSGNTATLAQFRHQVFMRWFNVLKRRSQRRTLTWKDMSRFAKQWLPLPKVYHAHPLERFGVITQGRSRMR